MTTPQRNRHLLSLLALGSATLLAFGSLDSKANLDQTVDKVLQELEECDLDGLKAMSHPNLEAKLSLEVIQPHCTLVTKLGAVKSRTMQGFNVQAGAPNTGTYNVVFDHGSATVEVGEVDGQMISYNLKGADVMRIMGEIDAEKYKEFAVHQFEWTQADGSLNARGNVFPRGKVHFKVILYGLTLKDGKMRLVSDLVIKDPKGKEVARYDKYLDQEIVVPEGGRPTATVNSWFEVNDSGTWTVEIGFTDAHSEKNLTYSQSVVIE